MWLQACTLYLLLYKRMAIQKVSHTTQCHIQKQSRYKTKDAQYNNGLPVVWH
jgi:hypothetical protein